MYNKNTNVLSAIIQSPISPRSTNVLWDDMVSNTLKVYRKGIWTVIGGAGGGGGEGSSLYWGYDAVTDVLFPLERKKVQINNTLTVNGDIRARKLSVEELTINGEDFTQYWELDPSTNTLYTNYQVKIGNNLIVEGDTSSGGSGQDTPSVGGSLSNLSDVSLGSLSEGDVLVYDKGNGVWYNVPQSKIMPNLAGYAKESWVQSNFLESDALETYKEELHQEVKTISDLLASMWRIEGDNLVTDKQVLIKNNLIVEQDTSSGGEGQDTPSAGLDEREVLDIVKGYTYSKSEINKLIDDVNAEDVDLTNYYTKDEVDAKIPSLDGYATEDYVNDAITALNLSQYAKGSDLDALQAEVDNIETVLGLSETAEGYINTWTEVVAFLDGYKNADDLATILSGINADIAKNAENIATLDNDKADKATTLAGYGITDAYTKSDLESYKTWWDAVMGLVVKEGNNIRIKTNLIIEGDTSSGGSGSDTPASGTVMGIKVNGKTYEPTSAGIVTIPDYPTSLEWSAINGKPTALSQFNNDLGLGSLAYLSGITSSMVTDALGYTPLSTAGGTLQGDSADLLVINRLSSTSSAYITFRGNDSLRGRIGFDANNNPIVQDINYGSGNQTLIHSGNYANEIGDYYLKSSGGTISGDTDALKIVRNTNGYSAITYYNTQNGATTLLGVMGFDSNGEPSAYRASDNVWRTLLHSGNYSDYALPLSGGTMTGSLNFNAGLSIKSANNTVLEMYSGVDTYLRGSSHIFLSTPSLLYQDSSGTTHTLIHSGNYSSYALPLSGGTIRGSVIISGNETTNVPLNIVTPSMGNTGYIRFGAGASSNELGLLGFSAKGIPAMMYEGAVNTLIHSGNIGDYALKMYPYDWSSESKDANTVAQNQVTHHDKWSNTPFNSIASLLDLSYSKDWRWQLFTSSANQSLYSRYRHSGTTWSDWKTIAFTDSNVASATKLETARTIWGQSFDGTGNVSGHLILNNQSAILSYTTSGTSLELFNISSNNNLSIGYSMAGVGGSYIYGNEIYLRYGSSRTTGLTLNSSGNVTIGGSDLAGTTYKMSVDGKVHIRSTAGASMNEGAGSLIVGNGTVLMIDANDIQAKTNGTTAGPLYINDWGGNVILCGQNNGNVLIGTTTDLGARLTISNPSSRDVLFLNSNASQGPRIFLAESNTSKAGFGYDGTYKVMWFENTSAGAGIYIHDSGNVGIGTANPAAKLHVSYNSGTAGIEISRTSNGDEASIAFNSDEYSMRSVIGGWGKNLNFYHNGATRMTISDTGAVTMSSSLSVGGNIKMADNTYLDGGGNHLIFTSPNYTTFGMGSKSSYLDGREIYLRTSGATAVTIASNGGVTMSSTLSVSGNITCSSNLIVSGDTSSGSDIRFKDIIKNKTLKIEHIAKAPLFTFKWNDREDDTIHLGSSAQYWEKVTPWLVKGEDFKTLDYSTLGVAMGISLAKKAVNHEERIEELEKKVKSLEEENRRLRYGN